MDDKKSVVMDKKFENSMFTKLVIERSNSTIFKSIYENKKISVWKVVNRYYSLLIAEFLPASITSLTLPAIEVDIPTIYDPAAMTIISNAPIIRIISALIWAFSSFIIFSTAY